MLNKTLLKDIILNAGRFLFNIAFIMVFQILFGAENILPAVAISVGFTMLPQYDLGIKPFTMFIITIFLYTGSGAIAQFAFAQPIIAFIFNFMFIALIILLTNEPLIMKPNISFLLCFVFSQSTPVPWDLFANRMLSLVCGSLLVGFYILINWYHKGYGKDGRNLKEQVLLCQVNRSYLFRMSFGIAIAMYFGMIFHVQKPLWISIVVMSLTQLEFTETMERIKHRFIGTLIGVICFFIFFQYLIPKEYAMLVVMFLGYIGFFFPEYKYKQIINAISALNASLVLLDTKSAIENRILFLIVGVLIVLFIYVMTLLIKQFHILRKKIKLAIEMHM